MKLAFLFVAIILFALSSLSIRWPNAGPLLPLGLAFFAGSFAVPA